MDEPIRVALVDDHPFFRDGVRHALRWVRDIKVVAEGASAMDALRIAQEEVPNILLLDLALPGGGIEAATAIAQVAPEVRVIMLTGLDDEEKVTMALNVGAHGFVLKGANLDELLTAIRTVRNGQPYVTPALSSRLLINAARGTRRQSEASARKNLSPLSQREQEVLDCVIRGLSNVEIAAELGLALPTVKNYMSRIFEKLQVRNRAEAVALSLRNA